jgi:hypothetical protein
LPPRLVALIDQLQKVRDADAHPGIYRAHSSELLE